MLTLGLGSISCTDGGVVLEDCYWIGSLNPLTGDLGPVGLPLENAARLAVQDINSVGTIGGKRLCVAGGDTRTDPNRARLVVDALVERNDIRAVNGAAASASTLEAAKAAQTYDMAIVSCCSTSPALSENPDIFRAVPSDALQGVALAQIARARDDVQRISVIFLNDIYGERLKDQFIEAYESLGGQAEISAAVSYDSNASSFSEVIEQAFAPDPDLAIMIAFPVAGARILQEWFQSRRSPDVQWLGTDGLKDEQFSALLSSLIGEDTPNMVGTAPVAGSRFVSGFSERYMETFRESPGIFTANQYDAVVLIALAMARVGVDPQPSAIKAAIPEIANGAPGDMPVHAATLPDLQEALRLAEEGAPINYEGVSGSVDLNEVGDVYTGYQLWSIPQGGGQVVEEAQCFDCQVDSSTAAAGLGVNCSLLDCMMLQ